MATQYIKSCDGCEKQEILGENPFGQFALPNEWIRVGEPQQIACSWECVSKIAKQHMKAEQVGAH